MHPLSRNEIRLARGFWIAFVPLYLAAVFFGLLAARAMPLFIAGPFTLIALLFAATVWHAMPRFAAIALLAAFVELVIAVLLLGGPGMTITIGARVWQEPPGLPASLVALAWYVGLLLPLVLAVASMFRLRRPREIIAPLANEEL